MTHHIGGRVMRNDLYGVPCFFLDEDLAPFTRNKGQE